MTQYSGKNYQKQREGNLISYIQFLKSTFTNYIIKLLLGSTCLCSISVPSMFPMFNLTAHTKHAVVSYKW